MEVSRILMDLGACMAARDELGHMSLKEAWRLSRLEYKVWFAYRVGVCKVPNLWALIDAHPSECVTDGIDLWRIEILYDYIQDTARLRQKRILLTHLVDLDIEAAVEKYYSLWETTHGGNYSTK